MTDPRLTLPEKRWTMADIRTANRMRGKFWFAPDTMRFFRSRLPQAPVQGPGGVFFVSSEEPPHGPRRYTVRQFDPSTGEVDTVGPFCAQSRAQAYRLAGRLAAGDTTPAEVRHEDATE